ncbi:MAG TPA: class I SAM-dependent methyltransferase [Candidatus Sulfotelmatobacter sp.]|nr:class I SAM-dependent methyltransferase [Candidatus Sulfotelmatobacter sp.]
MNQAVDRSSLVFWGDFWRNRSGGQGAFKGRYPREVETFVVDNLRARLPKKTGCVIDIGAGADLWLSTRIKQALPDCQLTALDILEAERVAPDRSGITYVQASACASGLAAASFDAVVSAFTVDYLDRDRIKTMDEIGRLLKPTGFALLVMHHKCSCIAPFFHYEITSLLSLRDALLKVLTSSKPWDRGRIAWLPGLSINSAELKRLVLNCRNKELPGPSETEAKALVREELRRVEGNLAIWRGLERNLFSEEGQVDDFFGGCGFISKVTTLLLPTATVLGFGVIANAAAA